MTMSIQNITMVIINMTMLIGHENENIQTASIQNTNNENLQSANDSAGCFIRTKNDNPDTRMTNEM